MAGQNAILRGPTTPAPAVAVQIRQPDSFHGASTLNHQARGARSTAGNIRQGLAHNCPTPNRLSPYTTVSTQPRFLQNLRQFHQLGSDHGHMAYGRSIQIFIWVLQFFRAALMPNVGSSRRSIHARCGYLLDLTDQLVLHATDDPNGAQPECPSPYNTTPSRPTWKDALYMLTVSPHLNAGLPIADHWLRQRSSRMQPRNRYMQPL